jgi:spoIIIJ-associated protein
MEWVETTGKTLEEAKDAALDQLGVDEADAEFQILEEPKPGLFGRVRGEARVRARVRPATPRPKDERRRRRKPGGSEKPPAEKRSRTKKEPTAAPEQRLEADEEDVEATEVTDAENSRETEVDIEAQATLAEDFIDGLLEALDIDADIDVEVGDDAIEVAVTGQDLGMLIGPKAATLTAIQELTRTAVQRHVDERIARISVDVAGYRQKRKEALERFTRQVAEEVLSSQEQRVLEPMSPADRKTVHDTANDIDGVTTSSQGEEPNRRVVIRPA